MFSRGLVVSGVDAELYPSDTTSDLAAKRQDSDSPLYNNKRLDSAT